MSERKEIVDLYLQHQKTLPKIDSIEPLKERICPVFDYKEMAEHIRFEELNVKRCGRMGQVFKLIYKDPKTAKETVYALKLHSLAHIHVGCKDDFWEGVDREIKNLKKIGVLETEGLYTFEGLLANYPNVVYGTGSDPKSSLP